VLVSAQVVSEPHLFKGTVDVHETGAAQFPFERTRAP
jgi:hypothetical protein